MKNIFYKITGRSLQKNKTRTAVTIIGVILSAALIIGVAAFTTSLQNYLITATIAERGNWHVIFGGISGTQTEALAHEPEVEKAFLMQHVGDTIIESPAEALAISQSAADASLGAITSSIAGGAKATATIIGGAGKVVKKAAKAKIIAGVAAVVVVGGIAVALVVTGVLGGKKDNRWHAKGGGGPRNRGGRLLPLQLGERSGQRLLVLL